MKLLSDGMIAKKCLALYFITILVVLFALRNQITKHYNKYWDLSQKKGHGTIPDSYRGLEEIVYIEYERYVTTLQTKCNRMSRCGGRNDNGYNICVDSIYKPKQPCLVYSFGSRFDFGFENDVFKKFNCEIHTFDPSIPLADHTIPKSVNFHLIGLSDTDHRNGLGWQMKTLSSIRTYLNHSLTHLDILKLDIEGYEWKALPQIISSVSSTVITQIVIEVHFGREIKNVKRNGFNTFKGHNWGSIDPYTQLNVLKQLKNYGFKTFNYQKNPRTRIQLIHAKQHSVFTCYVLAMKNINIS